MKDIEIINIDYSAKDPLYSRDEVHSLKDSPLPFIVPLETPFYSKSLIILNGGNPLTIEKDYWLEDNLFDLEEQLGKKIQCVIRLSKNAMNDFKELTVRYQKVGEVTLSRKYLLDSIETILNNPKVDWNTQVIGKPDTYPSAFHIHDIKTELNGFGDLVTLLKMRTGRQVKEGLDIHNQILALKDKYFKQLNDTYQKRWEEIFKHIEDCNVPHPMTKADIGLGNHPNYPTATIQEDMLGEEQYKLSTPLGFHQALEQSFIDTDQYIKQGTLPFSYYGSGMYLPPPISGSFEGLGTNTGGSCFCIEPNGYTVFITRGYDSKVRNLYYYYNKNIYDKNENFIFSGFVYKNQVMENNGHTPNHVLSGSDNRILVIGDKENGQYYIGLANGTLDYNAHRLIKIDMNSFTDPDGVRMFNPDKAYVMMIGDYVYVVCEVDQWASTIPDSEKFGGANNRRRSFYRVNVSLLNDSNTSLVTFTKQLMNYQNSEGEWKYNQEFVDIAKNVIEVDGNGKKILKRCVYNFTTPPTTNNLGGPWRCQWFNMQDPSNKNKAAVKMFHNCRWQYNESDGKLAGDWWFCIPMNFDVSTNTLTLDSRFFNVSRDLKNNSFTFIPEGRDRNEWYNDRISWFCAAHAEVAAAFIPGLGFVRAGTNDHTLPYNIGTCPFGYNKNESGYLPDLSDWDKFNKTLIDMERNGSRTVNVPLDSPFGFTTKPALQRDLWEYDGKVNALPVELFSALNYNGSKTLWGRITKDNYDYHESSIFNFKYIDKTIIGRTPSTMFMQVTAGGLNQNMSGKIPIVNISTKDKHSVQYGLVNLTSRTNNSKDITVTGGLYYSTGTPSGTNVKTNGDFYLSLLGKHTISADRKTMSIDRDPTNTVLIKKTVWIDLLKRMLGKHFNEITNEDGVDGSNGEWLLTIYLGSKQGSGNDVFPSIAMLTYHRFSNPNECIGVFITFNWAINGKDDTGINIVSFNNFNFISPNHTPDVETVISRTLNFTGDGKWTAYDTGYNSEVLTPELHMDFTDSSNYEIWVSNGINQPVPLNSASVNLYLKVSDNAISSIRFGADAIYNAGGLSGHWQYVTDLGMCRPLNASVSGGAALYVQGGKIPQDKYCLMQAVFIEGNWTLFVNTDMNVYFNGTVKKLPKTNYDLSELGIDPKNKTFYLYAVSGKVEGYYELTLAERTTSPYQIQVAIIKTNAFGIETIDIDQSFEVSGFKLSTQRQGGIIPATLGPAPQNTPSLKAIKKEDLFDKTKY